MVEPLIKMMDRKQLQLQYYEKGSYSEYIKNFYGSVRERQPI